MIGHISPLNFSNRVATCLIITFPLVYLSVRHAVNTILFLFVLLSILDWAKFRTYDLEKKNQISIWLAIFGFSSLILSTAITQLIRGDFHIQSFDGPSRLFLASVVFLYLLKNPILSIKILKVSLPIGLVLLFIAVQYSNGISHWGNRYSTSFVDPNTLGSQSSILGLICLFFISQSNQNRFTAILKVIGGFTGLYISIFAESRGGWLALPFLLILWIILTFQGALHNKKISRRQLLHTLTQTALVIGFLFTIAYLYAPGITTRLLAAHHDIINWLAGVDFNSSVGTRLAMWEISLFQLAPLGGFSGIGDISSIAATMTQLQLDPIKYKEAIFNLSYAGPHSDFLDNLLRMGYLGAAAYIITIAIPWLIFWKNRLNKNQDRRLAAHTGLYFMTGIFFCGLANGMITHKYTCSFYGLITACLLADVLRLSPTTHTQYN